MVVKEGIVQIVYNIIGGIIIGGLTLLGRWFYGKLHARKFNQIFQDVEGKFHAIYKSMQCPGNITLPAEKSKVSRATSDTKNVTLVTSCAEARGVGYVIYAFGENIGKSPLIVSHADVDQKMNLSFISIGGPTNLKTKDLMGNPANKLLDYEHGKIVAKDLRGDDLMKALSVTLK